MMIMCLSVLPSFASAEKPNLVNGIPFVEGSTPDYGATNGSSNGFYFFNSKTYNLVLKEKIENVIKIRMDFNRGLMDNDGLYVNLHKGSQTVFSGKVISLFSFNGKGYEYAVPEEVFSKYGYIDKISISTVVIQGSLQIKNFIVTDDSLLMEEISDLNVVAGVNDAKFTWKNPNLKEFTGLKIYKEDSLIATLGKDDVSYKVDGLEADKNYNFKFVATYGSKNSKGIQKGVKTLVDPKTVPPGPVSSLTAEPTDKTVKLKWKKPKDDDLAGFKILQNGKQVAEIGLEEEFTVKNLKPLTDYTFGVMAVDKDKNDSTSVNLSVKTLEENDDEPPLIPSNVFAKPSNGALIASWDKVSDEDLAGYNVYVDDKKINSNLILSTNFTIKNLENNRKYKIQVQAVDRSGNASALSLAAYGTPDEKTLPIIESKYSLQDVSDGVSVMFGQFWTVLAFAVGIPLAFYIIYKLKLTVLP